MKRALVLLVVTAGLACGSDGSDETTGAGGTSSSGGAGAGASSSGNGGDLFPAGNGGSTTSGQGGNGDACDGLLAVVRDFDESHIDFQDDNPGHQAGLVENTLTNGKPTYAHGNNKMGGIENAASFAEWYQDIDGTNQRFEITLNLTPTGNPDEFEYDNAFFFPVDGMGFGNSGADANGMQRNFHFTTEIHTQFEYQPGQVFTFRGDDDLWLFIDNQLAIDLGGVHGAMERTVQLDDLGLTAGETYPMDIFHAERHTSASNFRMVTTIDCFEQPPVPQ